VIAYGPVPSRRLGRSLGIDTIPSKVCSYGCVYCQAGVTRDLTVNRRRFVATQAVVADVRQRVSDVAAAGDPPDYLAFVPDGEPTLDVALGEHIAALQALGVAIAVISNGSLIARPDVRRDLAAADWVSLKVDTVDPLTWRRLNRPHRSCRLAGILAGMLAFAAQYRGTLVTETMLVAGLNDTPGEAAGLAAFLGRLQPDVAYVAVPTRPPARRGVRPAGSEALVHCHEVLARHVPRVELLLGYEGDAFTATGDPAADLLAITAVHPMRREAVADLLARAGADWGVVEGLVASGQLRSTAFAGHTYFLRASGRPRPRHQP